ncbi:long-chain fatty acid--CoA ligase [Limibacter armeniacum]|uniref:AMP-dependent synthetase/ligase n=1 Tax=Limibacter armeniacum TaxID=466084 RepID=UPI002FE60795
MRQVVTKHFAQALRDKAAQYGQRAALKFKEYGEGEWISMSWDEMLDKVNRVSKALLDFGIETQQKVGIFSQNMPEWSLVDFATLSIRGVVVPIYATSTAPQADYIINDAEINILFVGDQEQYDIAHSLLSTNEHLKKVIVFDDRTDLKSCPDAEYFKDFIKKGDSPEHDTVLQSKLSAIQEDDMVTLIYTSGTTGEPKGVMLDNANFNACIEMHEDRLNVNDTDTSIAFLPLSHIFERAWTYYMFYKGVINHYNLFPTNIKETLEEIRPTLICSVPRLYEKIYGTVYAKLETASPVKKALFNWAVNTGKKVVATKQKGQTPSGFLNMQYNLADKLVLSKIRIATGLENAKFLPCAGSKLSEEINYFLHAIGFNLKYGYGLSETCATVSCFDDHNYRLGTVGMPLKGIEIKLGENNEILVKSPTIMRGYYNKPEATAEVFEGEWFRTGDAGEIDEKGNLIFIERLKDLMKTAGGKYIAPQVVETTIGSDQYVEQIAIIGDERKFVSALIVPAFETLESYAKEAGIAFKDRVELIRNAEVIKLFENRINDLQKNLARFEQVKKFTLLPKEFTIENGEITPTLKIRRKTILQNFSSEIEAMYI